MNTESFFEVVSPVDGQVYLTIKKTSPRQVNNILNLAEKAQSIWKNTPLHERIKICHAALQFLLNQAEDIGHEITRQMGRPLRYSAAEITKGFQERADYMMEIAPEVLKEIEVMDGPAYKKFIRKEPVGTVLVLAPWNYPFLTSVNAIFPALIAGNCVLLKHSFQTPQCSLRYAEAFRRAGIPDGVFQYLFIDHEEIPALIGNRLIKYVSFTGSLSGGKAVQQAIRNKFIGVGLELGGKDPAYVRSDANFTSTVENLVDGTFFNSGQSCCGIERIYVHDSIFSDFVEAFVLKTKSYVFGNPLNNETTLGPMVRTSSAQNLHLLINETTNQGAKPWITTKDFPAYSGEDAYLPPQILTGVNQKSKFMQEECFGPVVGIVPVKSDQEAIRLMNDSRYGLTASIWTRDVEVAQTIGNQIDTGTVYMNRCDYLDPALAWTGVNDTGKGCTLSILGYNAFYQPKSFHLKK